VNCESGKLNQRSMHVTHGLVLVPSTQPGNEVDTAYNNVAEHILTVFIAMQ